MLSCESCQGLMADALYEQIDNSLELQMQQHLHSCAYCQAMQQELRAAQAQLQESGVHGPDFDDIPERVSLDDIWNRIEPALDRIDAQRYSEIARFSLTPWAAAITAIAASVLVFFAVSSRPLDDTSPQPQFLSTEGFSPELMNYLDRAQVMLMQVANTESANGLFIPVTDAIARNMAFEANLLSATGEGSVNAGQRKLLKDIEFLLLQIANLDESNMIEGVALLKQFLEQNSILFRIRLLEMRDQAMII